MRNIYIPYPSSYTLMYIFFSGVEVLITNDKRQATNYCSITLRSYRNESNVTPIAFFGNIFIALRQIFQICCLCLLVLMCFLFALRYLPACRFIVFYMTLHLFSLFFSKLSINLRFTLKKRGRDDMCFNRLG